MRPDSASVHVFTAPMQPALRFEITLGESEPFFINNKPRATKPCYGCRKRRHCENLGVQVFYDSIRYWCVAGKGCKK